MPTTRKQKSKPRKSREADMLSELECLDIMLGSNRLEREVTEFGNSVRRPESPSFIALADHDVNSHYNSRADEIMGYAGNGHNSREVDSTSDINKLSGELNQSITQEMYDLMSSLSSQIPRAISEAINEQVLSQVQATSRSGHGHVPDRRWETLARKPEHRLEEDLNRKLRSSSRDEFPRDLNRNEDLENTHYSPLRMIFAKYVTSKIESYEKSLKTTLSNSMGTY